MLFFTYYFRIEVFKFVSMSGKVYKFGNFALNAENRRFFDGESVVQLSARAFEILLLLVERRGAIVEKDEILEKIWANVFVEEINLAVHISALRRVLGEKRGENKFIETVSGRGYRFVADVREIDGSEDFSTAKGVSGSPEVAKNKVYALAVLPFADESGGAAAENLEYLTDGITETLINELSHLPQLKVLARSAVKGFRGTNQNLQEIGFLLGAEVILTGRIRSVGKHLDVGVELVNVADKTHIWGFQYDCRLVDILKIKNEIALAIAENLQIKLGKAEALLLKKTQPNNVDSEAYELCLKGRYLLDKRAEKDFPRAIEFFERALKKDPNYALAYAGIGSAYYLLGVYQFRTSPQIFTKAKNAVERALFLDETLAEAHAANADIQFRCERNWAAAEKSFRRAVALNPNDAAVYYSFTTFLIYLGRFRESVIYRDKALELDSTSAFANSRLAFYYNFSGEYAKAISQAEEVLEIESESYIACFHLAIAYAKLGLYDTALLHLERGVGIYSSVEKDGDVYNSSEGSLIRAWINASAGNTEAARRDLEEILTDIENGTAGFTDYYDIASVYAALGETDAAFDCLEKAIRFKSMDISAVKVDPRFESLRGEPRFASILKQIGLS